MAYNALTGYNFACANCGAEVRGATHACTSKNGRLKFCDRCAGYSEALGIGARSPAFLYDDGKGHATSWTGQVMGDIVHKNPPALIRGTRTMRRLGAVRYRVRMLDGSLWHGSGPTDNGTYIRLKPMAGE